MSYVPSVLVCGMPSSGNNLTLAHFERAGCRKVVIHHANPAEQFYRLAAVYDELVCVHRVDRAAWAASNRRHGRVGYFSGRYVDEHRATMEAVEETRRLWRINLEDIRATGGRALDDLMERMGIAPPRWPAEPPRGQPLSRGPVIGL